MSEQEERTPEEEKAALQGEIERTRAELGATVEALTHKADVKAQAREKVEHAKSQAQTKAHDFQQKLPEPAREKPIVPIAAGVGVLLLAVWLIRRR